jgi:hypothetical protein
MNNEQFELLLHLLNRQTLALEGIQSTLEQLTTAAPNYQQPLESFTQFNWESIGATVERSDQYGAAIVSWRGLQFVRRSPQNKFGSAVWFSRCVGKDDNGENKYERLITFKIMGEAEPIPEKVMRNFNAG